MALFNVNELFKVNKFENASSTKPWAYMGAVGNVGAGGWSWRSLSWQSNATSGTL
jgi:hypothetical protein